jgi:DtxR family transcriptional regulator, Mn-dependent transcriptional regulator
MNDSAVAKSPSSSVGDYLKAIWEIAGAGAASTTEVADLLSITPASVTNMFGRLREMDLVRYERYRGATLTEAGYAEALRLVRRHRLIETLLLEHLGYSWEEVHDEAERMEHVVSDGFTERLAEYLDHPAHDPHGAPIPGADGSFRLDDSHPLDAAEVGERVCISQVSNRDVAVLTYLGERKLVPGTLLKVKEVRALDGVVTVEHEDGTTYSLGEALAVSIFVRRSSSKGG